MFFFFYVFLGDTKPSSDCSDVPQKPVQAGITRRKSIRAVYTCANSEDLGVVEAGSSCGTVLEVSRGDPKSAADMDHKVTDVLKDLARKQVSVVLEERYYENVIFWGKEKHLREMKHWNRLPGEVMGSPSLEAGAQNSPEQGLKQHKFGLTLEQIPICRILHWVGVEND